MQPEKSHCITIIDFVGYFARYRTIVAGARAPFIYLSSCQLRRHMNLSFYMYI